MFRPEKTRVLRLIAVPGSFVMIENEHIYNLLQTLVVQNLSTNVINTYLKLTASNKTVTIVMTNRDTWTVYSRSVSTKTINFFVKPKTGVEHR